jgi:8-oxo-dGTP diphosphatase
VTAIHLIRHAKAKNRLEWTEPDELRPLTKRGRREAAALAERLEEVPLVRLVSSPHVRCVQTLEPLALTVDLPIETTQLLAEGGQGADAVELLVTLGSEGEFACCTHGDVLFEVLGIVVDAGVPLDGPRDAPVASTWILEVDDGRFTEARFVEQPPR